MHKAVDDDDDDDNDDDAWWLWGLSASVGGTAFVIRAAKRGHRPLVLGDPENVCCTWWEIF